MAVALDTQDYAITTSYHQDQRVMRRVMKSRDLRQCPHLSLWNDLCLDCGKKLHNNQVQAIPFSESHKNTTLLDCNKASISSSSNLETKMTTLPSSKKMYLVLDLDHTLLNSTKLDDLSKEEEYIRGKTSLTDASKRGLFQLDHISTITKLRPFVKTFLRETSTMFELCVYTLGDRAYALEMAKLLDPEKTYFGSRIISRDDCTQKLHKGLDVLQKPQDSVLVLDDTASVWPSHKDNLIVMDRYMYFSSSCRLFGRNCKSLSELKRDEAELNGALSSVMQVLKQIHCNYMDSHNSETDVRQLLKIARRAVLKGCKIVFSGVIPKNFHAADHKLWRMAEELGATCSLEIDTGVTHVVSVDAGTDKSRWAVQKGKFLVHTRWIEAAYYLWRRQVENKFPVKVVKSDI